MSIAQFPMPHFDVGLAAPDLSRWLAGNTGIAGFTSLEGGQPGPHVLLLGLTHGNEIAGAIVLERMLRASVRPPRGRLTLGFANLAAFARFDPKQPTLSRFVDEDMNRIWSKDLLDGPRRSVELDRARAIRPLLDSVDVLLDIHSMLWPSDPLILCGGSPKGRRLALGIDRPELVVADQGHASGKRIIDYERFVHPDSSAAAVLVEAGQHWEVETVETAEASVAGLLRFLHIDGGSSAGKRRSRTGAPRLAEVSEVVTAATAQFAFVQPFRGGVVIPRRNTLLALDGSTEILTPHDDCLLVMPSLRPSRGHTAVRLARLVGG